VVRAIVDWWDAVELWLTQLAFPFQVALAIVVGLPLCWLAAAGIDRLVDVVIDRATARMSATRSRTEPPPAP
jgi:4-hydroxybenzoate polyprenyltransferase